MAVILLATDKDGECVDCEDFTSLCPVCPACCEDIEEAFVMPTTIDVTIVTDVTGGPSGVVTAVIHCYRDPLLAPVLLDPLSAAAPCVYVGSSCFLIDSREHYVEATCHLDSTGVTGGSNATSAECGNNYHESPPSCNFWHLKVELVELDGAADCATPLLEAMIFLGSRVYHSTTCDISPGTAFADRWSIFDGSGTPCNNFLNTNINVTDIVSLP